MQEWKNPHTLPIPDSQVDYRSTGDSLIFYRDSLSVFYLSRLSLWHWEKRKELVDILKNKKGVSCRDRNNWTSSSLSLSPSSCSASSRARSRGMFTVTLSTDVLAFRPHQISRLLTVSGRKETLKNTVLPPDNNTHFLSLKSMSTFLTSPSVLLFSIYRTFLMSSNKTAPVWQELQKYWNNWNTLHLSPFMCFIKAYIHSMKNEYALGKNKKYIYIKNEQIKGLSYLI